jgi:hypothetical protein
MALIADEDEEEIETPLVEEAEAPPVEPIAEVEQPLPARVEEMHLGEPTTDVDQAWMPLVEDESMMEAAAPQIPEEEPTIEPVAKPEIAETPAPMVEPVADVAFGVAPETAEEPEVPAWAAEEAQPAEEEITLGPDWVLLTDDEEAEIELAKERAAVVSFGLEEPSPIEEAPVEEEAIPVSEGLPSELEPAARPTWVALEEAAAEEPAAIAQADEIVAEDQDDETRLETARRLWASGQKDEAHAVYEKLLKTSVRDEIITDLEQITAEEPSNEPSLRLLGDAYMRENRLQNALDAYRRALASL